MAQPADGGVARVVVDLVRAQRRAGLRPVVACPPDGPLAPAAAAAGARVLPWPAARDVGPRVLPEALRAARLVRAVRPDLVHLHSAKAGLAGRLAVRGRVPTVFQPHAWSFEAADGLTGSLALRWERFAARWADRVICVSEAERRRGLRHGVAARWSVVPNGVDTARFRPGGRAARRAARAALPALRAVPAGAPLAVCVGRLCRQKGQDVLLRAWPEVVRALPGARLALVGDGPDEADLRRIAPEGVLFAGACADTAPWYAAADVVVLPSRWEGMALAPLEAMACGRPAVVTDVAGAAESLPAGHAADCLVPPAEPLPLARALTALLSDPSRGASLGRAAARHVRAAHDVRVTAHGVLGLYGELLPPLPERLHQPEPASSASLAARAPGGAARPVPPAGGSPFRDARRGAGAGTDFREGIAR
ncbi:glycosyltransferase [Streptomyces sp. URMC 123]|uniref:glycosyltransferase n=1 Tax=Streptomyces sp. URMC 123 TaxID=3423403 RepID=UPI003F1A758B